MLKKKKAEKICNINVHLKKLEKEQQIKPN